MHFFQIFLITQSLPRYFGANHISTTEFLTLSILILIIGLSGIIFNYKNFLITMLSIELMYLGIITSFIIFSFCIYDPKGQIYALVLLIMAAAESSIGLGILIVLFRFSGSIEFKTYQELKG
jgi:NADH-quinone oxidoreductase subunit K